MTKNLKQTLINFGLNDKESAVYLAAMELGSATAGEISPKSGIKRSTTYVILDSLIEKGLVNRSPKEKTQLFTAQPPKKMLNILAEHLTDFKEILPQLTAVYNLEKRQPKIMIFEGHDAGERAYADVLESQGELLFFGHLEQVFKSSPRVSRLFEQKEKNKNFSIREILFDEPIARQYAKRNRGLYHQFRFLSKKHQPLGCDIGIYGHKILISALRDEIFIVCLEDDKIVDLIRLLFECAWQGLKQARD